MATPKTVRDLRESKNLSQDKVAAAAGLTYSQFVRVEEGSGKTTPAEVKAVMDILKGMEPGTRKLAGRPFKDPTKQAAVLAARAEGKSVAEIIGVTVPTKAPPKAATPAKPKTDIAKALAKKAPARSRKAPVKASAAADTSAVESLLP